MQSSGLYADNAAHKSQQRFAFSVRGGSAAVRRSPPPPRKIGTALMEKALEEAKNRAFKQLVGGPCYYQLLSVFSRRPALELKTP